MAEIAGELIETAAQTVGFYVSVPIGRSRTARMDVWRYWYHDLQGRQLNADGSIAAYPLIRTEQELVGEYRDGSDTDLFIYLSPQPSGKAPIRIDLAALDADQFRLTGQAEGYAIYRGNIPKTAHRCGF